MVQSNPTISNSVNSKSPRYFDRIPLDLPLRFQSFTFCYFELGYFEFPAISNLSFSPYTLIQPRYFELVKNNKSVIETLSLQNPAVFCCWGSRDSTANKPVAIHDRQKYKKIEKQQNIQRFLQCNICSFIRHLLYFYLISAFLHTYCTVFYEMMIHCYEFYTSRLFRNPAISNLFPSLGTSK